VILLKLISWQYVRKHLLRTALTVAGIVIGVAVFVGMHTANQSVLFAFNQTINQIAGATQIQITAGEPGFDEEVLEKVQNVPGVRVAVPVIEATAATNLPGQGNLLVLGVDMTGDRSLRSYDLEGAADDVIDDPLIFLAQPDSLIVTRRFAEANNLSISSKIPMDTMAGRVQFTVRGIMKDSGLASAFGGNLAIMDIYAAQKMFGRGRKFDRVDVAVQEDESAPEVQARIEKALGEGFAVEPPSSRGQQFENTAQIYTLASTITSLFAVFIGMFIIYNTFAIAVTQRRGEIGILRALGATRAQIRTLFLGESAVLGMLGSALGVLAGIGIGRIMAGYIGNLLGEVYGIAQRAEELSLNPRLLGFAMLIGALTSVAAALLPARTAAATDPVKALHKGGAELITERENRMRRLAALIAIAGAILCLWFSQQRVLFYAGYMLAVIAALLMTPTFSLWISKLFRPFLKAFRPVEGTLAADSLIQAPRRTSGTVAALMLSLALVVSLSGLARASYGSITQWMNIALNPDLFVSTSESITARSFVFPAEIGEQLKRIEGVDVVQSVRSVRVLVPSNKTGTSVPVMLVGADIDRIAERARLPVVAGDAATMYQVAGAGQGVVVSDNFALLHGYRLGDPVEIPSPSGVIRLPVSGIVIDYSDQQGSILMSRRLFSEKWNDSSVNVFRIYLKPGASDTAVRQAILDRFGSERRLFVFTNRELRAYVLRLTDQWFGLTYVQIAVAVLVAILGIVNSLTVSITDRRRELGVIQAVGGLRKQIRHTIWMEAAAIGVLGLILGLALGAAQLYYTLEIAERDLAGLRLNYEYPVGMALALLPVILSAAFFAALGPAESAVRGSLVEALEYE
jgi:putative ABC transport system permease protein